MWHKIDKKLILYILLSISTTPSIRYKTNDQKRETQIHAEKTYKMSKAATYKITTYEYYKFVTCK